LLQKSRPLIAVGTDGDENKHVGDGPSAQKIARYALFLERISLANFALLNIYQTMS